MSVDWLVGGAWPPRPEGCPNRGEAAALARKDGCPDAAIEAVLFEPADPTLSTLQWADRMRARALLDRVPGTLPLSIQKEESGEVFVPPDTQRTGSGTR